MLTTPHAVCGAAIGAVFLDPIIVVPAAIASHFILDRIPHWQLTLAPYIATKKEYLRIAIDIALATALILLAIQWQPEAATIVIVGAVAANLPDLDSLMAIVPRLKNGILIKYWDWHCKIQRETSSYWGLAPQFVVVVAGLLAIKFA